MTRVIWSVMSSLDGYSAAPGTGFETIDWFRADEEWLDYSVELLDQAETLLFGGLTFAGMEQYWPSAEGPVADRMNALDKLGSRIPLGRRPGRTHESTPIPLRPWASCGAATAGPRSSWAARTSPARSAPTG